MIILDPTHNLRQSPATVLEGRKAAVDANAVSRKSYLFASEQANVGPIHRNVHGIARCMTVGCSHDKSACRRLVSAASSTGKLERARQRPGSREPDRVIHDYLDSASVSWSSVFIAHSWVQVSRNNSTPF